jgi:hypothetical protein
MYGVIYWKGNRIFFATNPDFSVATFEKIEEADNLAEIIEEEQGLESRTVNLEGVKE